MLFSMESLKKPLRPIFYDTETTGIKADRERIVELAAYDPVLDRTFEMLINPGIPIPKEATDVHKITDAMVADKPSFAAVAEEFVTFCGDDTVLIAHNNDAFDVHFMKAEFSRNNLSWPSWIFFDTLKWARRYRPDIPKHSLQFLREIYGIAANNAHRALDDVKVLYEVFCCMVDDLTIEEAMRLLNQPRIVNNMPFGKHQGKLLKDLPKDYVQWLDKSGALDKEDNKHLKQALVDLGVL